MTQHTTQPQPQQPDRFTSKQQSYHQSLRRLTDEQIQSAYLSYYMPTDPLSKPSIGTLATLYNVSYNCMFRALHTEHIKRSKPNYVPTPTT